MVSIHAPAWGATAIKTLYPVYSKFQSTHPHGVRRQSRCRHATAAEFQSTHPHGVRRDGTDYIRQTVSVSIHAPAWGAPQYAAEWVEELYKFQSTPPHGVRL